MAIAVEQHRSIGPRAPMQPRFVRVFNFDIENATIGEASNWLVSQAKLRRTTSVAFLNAHCINVASTDAAYARSVLAMDRLYGDGIGIRLAAKAAGVSLTDNVNGTDLFPVLCATAAAQGVSMFLFGAREGIAAAAGAAMQRRVEGLTIAGAADGYTGRDNDDAALIAQINASGAGILLVALGVPQQELWIARHRHRLNVPVVIGVGGLFDYYSGRIARAPAFVRRWHCEWVWRLALEPRRLAQRYLIGNATFLGRLAWQRLRAPRSFGASPIIST